jgi:hypothetical protein
VHHIHDEKINRLPETQESYSTKKGGKQSRFLP